MLDEHYGSSRILVVDDQAANLRLLAQALRNQGVDAIDTTDDPRQVEALYQLHRHDVILLDLSMPHLNGFEVMGRLSTLVEDDFLPVIVLTADNSHATKLKALSAGARDFITKPYDLLEVQLRVRHMLEAQQLRKRVGMQKAALEHLVRERTRELEDTQCEVIRRLARAAEFRDNDTGAHIIRMSSIAAALARNAGLPEESCQLILNAAPMHDVGKIGIPDHILLKPGKLTPEEFAIMQGHAEIGARIMGGHHAPLLRMAHSIALHHHERWNGSGYPFGLKGNKIPIEGRIVAIADVYDALISHRPYKRAWTIEAAFQHIEKQAGIDFDPTLVAVFLAMRKEIEAISASHRDFVDEACA